MDNGYAAFRLLVILAIVWNLCMIGTCKSNQISSASDILPLRYRPRFIDWLVGKRLNMVITRWKDSRILQIVSTTMNLRVKTIGRRIGLEILKLACPNDFEYQIYMDRIDDRRVSI